MAERSASTQWDRPEKLPSADAELLDAIAACPTCVFVGNRADRRPVEAVVEFRVIGHAEVVDDPGFIRDAYRAGAHRNILVSSGRQTVEEYLDMAVTPNRRLFNIVVEKVVSLDFGRLPLGRGV